MTIDSPTMHVATNNGDIGGGEVMLLAIAEALRSLGIGVTVIGPCSPRAVLDAASERGFSTIELPAAGRWPYMQALRSWRRRNPGALLWCNGLVPSAATAGYGERLVHLHQNPQGVAQRALVALARVRARAVLVPSAFVAGSVRGARVLHNWVAPVETSRVTPPGRPVRVGYLGRLSVEKGLATLAEALGELTSRDEGSFELVIAGESRFVDPLSAARVEEALDALGTRVSRLGWAKPEDLFSQIDLLAVPSIAPESFGLVAAEAMSARIPVVVTDAGALPEVVGADHPWVARAGDSADLARAIRAAVDSLPREDLVERPYERWSELFSPEAGRQRVLAVLRELGLAAAVRR